ncbi:hypothetical protein [Hydrogenimonas sp.]
MKKLLFLSLLAASLMAGQYAKLKDGTIIILKDDGTWEKVETVPQGAPVAPPPAPAPAQAAPRPQGAAVPPPPPPPPAVDPLAQEYARKLQGVWENFDGSLKYIVRGDEVTFVDGRKKRTGKFTVKSVKPDKRQFILNIGEVGSAGYFSFGGTFRKLAFSPDFKSLTDYSAPMPTELRKVK